MGRRREKGRPVNGILLLDKAIGISSNKALQEVKHLFNARKAGHTGSLDPLASGLLPICLGEATKLSSFLLDSDKRYEGICKLGAVTTTADAEGEVIESKPVPALSRAEVEAVLQRYTGDLEQIPPMHSAIKQNGQPLYKLARQGVEVERQPRQIHIYELRLREQRPDELDIFVKCSKGTYIRTLAEDIGRDLGCGAHLGQLRRTGVGPFNIENAYTLAQLSEILQQGGQAALDALLLPLEAALGDFPDIHLTDNGTFYVQQGQPVQVAQAPTEGLVRLYSQDERFLGVGQILDDGRVAPKRLLKATS
ncbi:MAG: tRNA pseudouridine(55) synthase TruB [Gammaproteobacteria bacterium]